MELAEKTNHNIEKVTFGFWVYIMTDCVLFASLFATYAVLRNSTFGGKSGLELFNMPYILVETMLLLTSSFTIGLGLLAASRNAKKQLLGWLSLTFILGLGFLVMELAEFSKMIAEGNGFQRSGFLSSYFTLVGTHGLHISAGLLWIIVMIFQVSRRGLKGSIRQKIACLGLFWHFLDVIWILIFSIVYLMGVS